jgi:hypothetical protein
MVTNLRANQDLGPPNQIFKFRIRVFAFILLKRIFLNSMNEICSKCLGNQIEF